MYTGKVGEVTDNGVSTALSLTKYIKTAQLMQHLFGERVLLPGGRRGHALTEDYIIPSNCKQSG
jgi:hypothetical protein